MACYYIMDGKKYSEDEFKERLRSLPLHEVAKFIPGLNSIPDAPFKTSWESLALKRMIRYAAEHGYEKIAWTPGSVQAERYDLSKQVRSISIFENPDGTFRVYAQPIDGEVARHVASDVSKDKLADVIGKEAAAKILEQPVDKSGARSLEGENLHVGGEGMAGFYDKILPAAANKLVKKFGAKAGEGVLEEVPAEAEGWESTGSVLPSPAQKVHTLDITPQLRDAAVGHGFALFEDRGGPFTSGFAEGGRGPFSRGAPGGGAAGRTAGSGGGAGAPPPGGTTAAAAGGSPSRPSRIRNLIAKALESRLANKIMEGAQDLSLPVKRLQAELEARRGSPFEDKGNFYTAKRVYPGRVGNEVSEFNHEHLDPLVKLMKDNGISLKEAGDYVYAKHVWERNDYLGGQYPPDHQFNKARTDASLVGASGRSQQWANEVVEQARRTDKLPIYERIAARVQRIREYALQKMVDGQLLDPATADTWRARYNHYVDLRGFEDAPEEAPSDYREPARFSVRGKEVKQAFGRESKADNPIINMIDQAYRTIDRAERNRYLGTVWNALSGMAREARDAGGPGISDIVQFDRGTPKKMLDKNTGLVKTVDDSSYAGSPNTVSLKIGGTPHHLVFKNRDIAEAIKRMSPDGLGIFQGLVNLENKLKALWTHYSPDFLFRHFVFRYPIEGTLNSFEQKEGGSHSVVRYIKNGFPFLGTASRAIFASHKGERMGSAEGREMQDYWDEMRKAGGSMTFRAMRDMDLLREHLETQLMALKGKPVASAREKWRRAVEGMDVVTNALDNALRLAAYASARKQGKTPQQAALIAREATVDFQLKGKWSNLLALIWPFANVAVQTGFRMSKAVARSRIMRRVFMGTMLAGFLTSAFNYLIGGDDKDGIPFFEKIPDWDRRLNFIILNPFDRDEEGRPTPIKIPMPYNWAFPLTLGYAFGARVFGKESLGKTLTMASHSGIEVLTPFGQEENVAALLAPELARPIIYMATNKDYAGRPVHQNPTFQKGPNAEAGRRNTGEGWKAIASNINRATGGSKAESGWIDVYPEDYRQVFNYVAGTQFRLGQNLYESGKSIAQGKAPEATHMPLERVVRGTDYDAANRSLFYDQRREVHEAYDSAQIYRRDDDSERGDVFRKEHAAELQAYQAFKTADDTIKAVRQRAYQAKNDETLTSEERTATLDALAKEELAAMALAREVLNNNRKDAAKDRLSAERPAAMPLH